MLINNLVNILLYIEATICDEKLPEFTVSRFFLLKIKTSIQH